MQTPALVAQTPLPTAASTASAVLLTVYVIAHTGCTPSKVAASEAASTSAMTTRLRADLLLLAWTMTPESAQGP
ncbi:hypothetical protein Psuf_055740 [Phytohabitans suffuscus]|uniref:Uncharacterized protein n=1 Tax=Phytohabitans suffuscus TaxID=624315 RepID=A0A6F8YQW3_9ACTN|nr:hypothetical protein Psuf_055740 [Phytohabitans suffuscus]